MARIRTVKPEFFRSAELYDAEVAVNAQRKGGSYICLRVGFLGLITAADREGRFRWLPRELKLDCLPHDQIDFAALMDFMAAWRPADASAEFQTLIQPYEINGMRYGWIPGFCRHQRPHVQEAASKLPLPIVVQSDDDRSTIVLQSTLDKGKGTVNGKGMEKGAAPPTTAFVRPSIEDVKTYCQERGKGVDAERWMAHYESNGWRVGRNPMKDWKAAVRTWEHNSFDGGGAHKRPPLPQRSMY